MEAGKGEPDYRDLSTLINLTIEAHCSPLFNFKGDIISFIVVYSSATKFQAFGGSYPSFLEEGGWGWGSSSSLWRRSSRENFLDSP